jgi:predicted transcriptional regulator
MTAQQLRVARARLAISQYELAQFLGVPQSRISRAEHGETRLTPEESHRARQFFADKQQQRRKQWK